MEEILSGRFELSTCRQSVEVAELETDRLTFIDLSTVITDWLRANR